MSDPIIILIQKNPKNYVWVYRTNNDYLIKLGKNNNTQFNYITVNNEMLQNIISLCVKINKTHKYYYINLPLQ